MRKYSIKAIQFSILISIIMIFTGCKLIDDVKAILEKENIQQVDNTEPPTQANSDPGASTEHFNDESARLPEFRSPPLMDISYIKVNDQEIDIQLDKVIDVYRGQKNKNVAIVDSQNINSIEFGFKSNPRDFQFGNYIKVSVISLSGQQNLYFSYNAYASSEVRGEPQLEEGLSLGYDDFQENFYTGFYGSSFDEINNIVAYSDEKLTLNITDIVKFLMANHPNDPDPRRFIDVDNRDYDIASQFFANELYRLNITINGQLHYNGQIFTALSNCIYTSNETAPADVDDICKAYMALY